MTVQQSLSIGPELPEFGSWNWLGKGLIEALHKSFAVSTFSDVTNPPAADVIIFLKFKPPCNILRSLKTRSRLVFLPVDVYGSCEEIDNDIDSIRSLDGVIVHSKRLSRYFLGNTIVEYLDHPLKFALSAPRQPVIEGPLLWIGRKCNLEPVRTWWDQHAPSGELWILTENVGPSPSCVSLGFRSDSGVRVSEWSKEKHLEWTSLCLAAVDIKANDFRSRHKPPAKAYDFVSSGVPVISNRGSSVDLHLQSYGIRPLDMIHWRRQMTEPYLGKLDECAARLHRDLTPQKIWLRFSELLNGQGVQW